MASSVGVDMVFWWPEVGSSNFAGAGTQDLQQVKKFEVNLHVQGRKEQTAPPAVERQLEPSQHQGTLWPEAESHSSPKARLRYSQMLPLALNTPCCRLPGSVVSHTHLVCHQNGCDVFARIASNWQDDEAQEGF